MIPRRLRDRVRWLRLLRAEASKPSYMLNHAVDRVPLVDLRMWFYARSGMQLEDPKKSIVLLGTRRWALQRVAIGRDSVIGREGRIDARGGVSIGRSVNIAANVSLQTGRHDITTESFEASYAPIVLEDLSGSRSEARC